MNPNEQHLTVQRTARYYTIGEPGPEVAHCIIACHGYGQLAGHFIRKFDRLAHPSRLIVAPEGLSRFYWQGLAGEVKASWMTREDRLSEIADNAAYLSRLYQEVVPRLHPEVRVTLFGFSQGCATQVRWVMEDFPEFDNLVLWAGTLPEDLDYKPAESYWASKSLYFAYGHDDPFLNPERLVQHRSLLARAGLLFEEIEYQGKHSVPREAVAELIEKLERKA